MPIDIGEYADVLRAVGRMLDAEGAQRFSSKKDDGPLARRFNR